MKFASLFILLILITSLDVASQISTNITLSGKHLKKVERAKDVHHKLKTYKRLVDKQERKALKHYKDSLKQLAGDYAAIDSSMVVRVLPDSATTLDSLSWALDVLANHQQLDDVRMILTSLDSTELAKLKETEITPKLEEMIADQIPKEAIPTPQFDQMQNFSPGPLGEVDPDEAMNKLEGMDPKEQIEHLQENINQEQLAQLGSKLHKAQEKYIDLPDLSKSSETELKKNALSGTPFFGRLTTGGNVSITSTDPLAIDTDIRVGYKIDKRWTLGTGIHWRESFGSPDSASFISNAAHGYQLYLQYDMAKGLFALAEYGQIRENALFNERNVTSPWQFEYLLGLGRSFSITRNIKLQFTILYDFNYRNNSTHPRPFVTRIGYNIEGLGKKK